MVHLETRDFSWHELLFLQAFLPNDPDDLMRQAESTEITNSSNELSQAAILVSVHTLCAPLAINSKNSRM